MSENVRAKKHGEKHGVYAELDIKLFERLVERRKKNKEQGLVLDSNYKLIEAGVEMILEHCDEMELYPPKSVKEAV